MEETISLNEILEILKKRLNVIIASIIIIPLLVGLFSIFIITPTYEASSQFIVNQQENEKTNQFDSGMIKTNIELINTYNVIITSRAILDNVIEELNLPYSADQLASDIFVSSEQDSQVVTVYVANPSQETAAKIANEVVSTFKEKIPDIMNVDNVSVLTTAEVVNNPSPVNPNVKLNIAIGLVLGLMVGIGTAFLLEYFDTTIKTKEDIERKFSVPVIGMISTVETEDLDKEKEFKTKESSVNV